MPFPKDCKRAEEVVESGLGTPLVNYKGVDLLLVSYEVKKSSSYGSLATMEVENEAGEQFRVFTFSGVVIDQLTKLDDYIPIIIQLSKTENYYTIY